MKCLLSVLSFAVLSIALFTGSSASAASPWDNSIQTTDELVVLREAYYGKPACEPSDLSLTWSQYITGTARDSFEIALASGSWAVVQDARQTALPTVDYQSISIMWSETPAEIRFTEYNGEHLAIFNAADNSNIKFAKIDYSDTDDCQLVMTSVQEFPSTQGYAWATSIATQWGNKTFLVANATYILPDGYEGAIPPETPHGGDYNEGTNFTPTFDYTVIDKRLELTDTTDIKHINDNNVELCLFQVPNNKYGDNFMEYEYDCGTSPLVVHNFDENGSYPVTLRMMARFNDEFIWYESQKVLNIDGSTYSGSYNENLNRTAIEDTLRRFKGDIFGGGLTDAVTAPLVFLSTLGTATSNCTPIYLTLPMLGTNVKLPCLSQEVYSQHFNGLYIIWQTLLSAITAYWLSIRFVATIKDVSTPQNDRIEVANL